MVFFTTSVFNNLNAYRIFGALFWVFSAKPQNRDKLGISKLLL